MSNEHPIVKNSSSSWAKEVTIPLCQLYGSQLCKHPDTCSGYDNRQCTDWMRHSEK